MKKPILVAALTAALAFSGMTATPAQANDRDVRNAIAALAAIAIIGAAVNHNNNQRGRDPAPSSRRLESLPGECVVETWGRRGPDHVLSAHCVNRAMRHPERLPAACEISVPAPRGRYQDNRRDFGGRGRDREMSAYDISCLTRAGYRFDR